MVEKNNNNRICSWICFTSVSRREQRESQLKDDFFFLQFIPFRCVEQAFTCGCHFREFSNIMFILRKVISAIFIYFHVE